MTHLHVSVRLHGRVVDQRLCAVADEVWLGDHDRAEVAFPGACLRVRRFGERLQAHGVWLEPGRLPRPTEWAPDLRLLLASAAVVLFGAWWEAAGAFAHDNAALLASVVGERPVAVVLGDALGDAPITATASTDAVPPAPHGLEALPPVDVQVLPPAVRWSPR